MNVVTVTETALRQFAPAVVVPPGTWNPHMPTHTSLKIPVGVPEGGGIDRLRWPLQCGAATSATEGLPQAPGGEDGRRHWIRPAVWPALDKESRS